VAQKSAARRPSGTNVVARRFPKTDVSGQKLDTGTQSEPARFAETSTTMTKLLLPVMLKPNPFVCTPKLVPTV
jgi:hypothetical protein